VNTLVAQSDGKILVGGHLLYHNGTVANGIFRLNGDGSRDTSFIGSDKFNTAAMVYAISVQSDGKILVGGNFSSYSGSLANKFIRLNSD
jgi:hypothetical protein